MVCVPAVAWGQRPPTRPDTLRRPAHPDTLIVPRTDSAQTDSTPKAPPPPDTIKTPLTRPYTPRSMEIGANGWHWDRDALFASGAITLGDLLAQIPGVTPLMAGFTVAPQVAAWYGDPGHVRLFLDGVELDPINVRNGGIPDLVTVPLWALEDVQAERAAGELRVHLRTWRVDRTTASTRADILTGSENLNLYRGFFGRRFGNGMALQLVGQQQSTLSRPGLDGSALGGFARVGWAGGNWSLDGTLLHQGLDRNAGIRFLAAGTPQLNASPPFKGSEGVAYFRAAWRDPNVDGPWLQLIAATISAGENNKSSSSLIGTTTTTTSDTVDTMAVRAQYTVAAGITRWGLRLSTTDRLRSIGGKAYLSPGGRLEYDSRRLGVGVFAERGVDSTTRTDALGRLTPFSWLQFGGAFTRVAPKNVTLGSPTVTSRLETALKMGSSWVTAGMVNRGATHIAPPIELDTAIRAVATPAANGIFVSFRGPLFWGWSLDFDGINWNAPGPYLPQTQTRTRLWFGSSFLGRFPRGNFHLAASFMHEYRSQTYAPLGTNPLGQVTPGAGILSSLLEIRIGTATLSWQTRNPVGAIYETYPGYLMPRLVNVYGVRWEFWN